VSHDITAATRRDLDRAAMLNRSRRLMDNGDLHRARNLSIEYLFALLEITESK
jgi:hypothetical protein